MLLSILRRFGVLLASLAVSTLLVFAFMQVLPGDPARVALGVNASDAAVAALRQEYGLDRPLAVQYLTWVGGLLRGDMGTSYVTGAATGPQIADRWGVTLWLAGAGMLIALLIAVPAGTFSAVKHRSPLGLGISALSQVGVAVPAFLAGITLITVFAVQWRVLPANGWTPPAVDPGRFLQQLILPALSLGLVQGAVLTRYVRSSVLEVLREDYLRTARSKGLAPWPALVRHGLRNAAVPVITVLGLQLAALLIGAVVVERVFVIPGLGSLLLDAVATRDLLMVQNVVMLLVLAVLLISFIVEVLYVVVDPRLRVRSR